MRELSRTLFEMLGVLLAVSFSSTVAILYTVPPMQHLAAILAYASTMLLGVTMKSYFDGRV